MVVTRGEDTQALIRQQSPGLLDIEAGVPNPDERSAGRGQRVEYAANAPDNAPSLLCRTWLQRRLIGNMVVLTHRTDDRGRIVPSMVVGPCVLLRSAACGMARALSPPLPLAGTGRSSCS